MDEKLDLIFKRKTLMVQFHLKSFVEVTTTRCRFAPESQNAIVMREFTFIRHAIRRIVLPIFFKIL